MSELKPDQILVVLLEQLPAEQEFSNWPLHITVLPWFNGVDQTTLDKELLELTANTTPIKVDLGAQEMFGANKDTPVRTLNDSPELVRIHQKIKDIVTASSGNILNPKYTGKAYRSHVTIQSNKQLQKSYILDNLTLVERTNKATKRAIRIYELQPALADN